MPSSGGGVIVCEGFVTGFIGLLTFSSLLTLSKHSQNLKQAHSDVLVGFVLFWGLFIYV